MCVIPKSIETKIQAELSRIELENDVKILFACESGSRAWGFHSADSDFDVRFLYVRPIDWYLSIDVEDRRDVIERPIDEVLDISGWDIRKALGLFSKSNPPLNEWLFSPIKYRKSGWFLDRMQELAPDVYSPIAASYHYLSMVKRNYRAYLRGETVIRKKYLYVLRPLLAVLWIESGQGVVPMEFSRLVDSIDLPKPLKEEIEQLLAAKRAGTELARGPQYPQIQSFVEQQLAKFESGFKHLTPPVYDKEELSDLFRKVLRDPSNA